MWKPKDPEAFKTVMERYEKEKEEALKRLKNAGEAEFWGVK
jgi:hypothetical protein